MTTNILSDTDQAVMFAATNYSQFAAEVKRIQCVEESIAELIQKRKRIDTVQNVDTISKEKILRTFISHEFVERNEMENAHFILTIQGHILDSNLTNLKIGNFYDRIRIQVEKKVGMPPQISEWNINEFRMGCQADVFRAKIYSDQTVSVRIFFVRTMENKQRYDLSAKLQKVLPNMRPDPTDEDLCLGLWHYVNVNKLIDKKFIRCDQDLRDIFGIDSLSVTSLRQRISEHLAQCRPVLVDYLLCISPSFSCSFNDDTRFGPQAFTRTGGRAFDITVNVMDEYNHRIVEKLNDLVHCEYKNGLADRMAQMETKAQFLAKEVLRSFQRMEALKQCERQLLSSITCVESQNIKAEIISTGVDDNNNNNSMKIKHASDSLSTSTASEWSLIDHDHSHTLGLVMPSAALNSVSRAHCEHEDERQTKKQSHHGTAADSVMSGAGLHSECVYASNVHHLLSHRGASATQHHTQLWHARRQAAKHSASAALAATAAASFTAGSLPASANIAGGAATGARAEQVPAASAVSVADLPLIAARHTQPPLTESAVHLLKGFLDMGDTALFQQLTHGLH